MRNPASFAAPPALHTLRTEGGPNFAARLRQGWNALLRIVTDAPEPHPPWYWPDYLRALAVTGLSTAIAFPLSPHFGLVNIVMVYLLATTMGALRLGRGPSVLLATEIGRAHV